MARTRAGQSSARRAVAAKAPRKLAVAPPPTRVTPTASKSKVSKKKSSGGGGNSLKKWPMPSWQKGIQSFYLSPKQSSTSFSSDNNSENDESFEGPSGSGNNIEQCSPPTTTKKTPVIDTDSESEE